MMASDNAAKQREVKTITFAGSAFFSDSGEIHDVGEQDGYFPTRASQRAERVMALTRLTLK